MDIFFDFVGIVGFFGFVACLIMLIIFGFEEKSLKIPAVSLAICLFLIIAGRGGSLGGLFILAGFFGIFIGLIILVVYRIKKKPLKIPAITLAVFFALFIVGINMNDVKLFVNEDDKAVMSSETNQVAEKNETIKQVTIDKEVADKAVADKAVADKATADKATADKAAADKAAADKAAEVATKIRLAELFDKIEQGRIVAAIGLEAADKAAADQAAADKAAADKAAADKAAADKAAADKAAADKAAADKAAAEQAVADKAAADQAAAEQTAANTATDRNGNEILPANTQWVRPLGHFYVGVDLYYLNHNNEGILYATVVDFADGSQKIQCYMYESDTLKWFNRNDPQFTGTFLHVRADDPHLQ